MKTIIIILKRNPLFVVIAALVGCDVIGQGRVTVNVMVFVFSDIVKVLGIVTVVIDSC